MVARDYNFTLLLPQFEDALSEHVSGETHVGMIYKCIGPQKRLRLGSPSTRCDGVCRAFGRLRVCRCREWCVGGNGNSEMSVTVLISSTQATHSRKFSSALTYIWHGNEF